MWARGLKHLIAEAMCLCIVAPCVGAWIETAMANQRQAEASVAPCVGAWIETQQRCWHHSWKDVAPCVGAWIETDGEKHTERE